MSKVEKIWLWVSLAMFLVPEILFSNILSFMGYFSGGEIMSPFSLITNNYHLQSHVFLVILIIEIIGALGLFIFSIKNRKWIFVALLAVILCFLFFIFSFIKAFSNFGF